MRKRSSHTTLLLLPLLLHTTSTKGSCCSSSLRLQRCKQQVLRILLLLPLGGCYVRLPRPCRCCCCSRRRRLRRSLGLAPLACCLRI